MSETQGDSIDKADTETLEAIRVVTKHLRDAWISEGCRTHPQWGCASCEAVELERRLQMLAAEIRENAGMSPHI